MTQILYIYLFHAYNSVCIFNQVYFDDPVFNRISDQTRCCNECRTCCCGGSGERIQIDSPCCFNICQRGSYPCPCVPICCPTAIFSCALKYELYVEDAQKGMYEIQQVILIFHVSNYNPCKLIITNRFMQARLAAYNSSLYQDENSQTFSNL